jgi:hypothetical protein
MDTTTITWCDNGVSTVFVDPTARMRRLLVPPPTPPPEVPKAPGKRACSLDDEE